MIDIFDTSGNEESVKSRCSDEGLYRRRLRYLIERF